MVPSVTLSDVFRVSGCTGSFASHQPSPSTVAEAAFSPAKLMLTWLPGTPCPHTVACLGPRWRTMLLEKCWCSLSTEGATDRGRCVYDGATPCAGIRWSRLAW